MSFTTQKFYSLLIQILTKCLQCATHYESWWGYNGNQTVPRNYNNEKNNNLITILITIVTTAMKKMLQDEQGDPIYWVGGWEVNKGFHEEATFKLRL